MIDLSELGDRVPVWSIKPLHALWGLFSEFGAPEIHDDEGTGRSLIQWGDVFGFGGHAAAWIPRPRLDEVERKRLEAGEIPPPEFSEDPGGWLWWAALQCSQDPNSWDRALAVMAVAYRLHGQEGAFCLERVAEVLHGKRDQRRSRDRQLRPIMELLRFFSCAEFILDAGAKPQDKPRRESSDIYTGRVHGPLLVIEATSCRRSTIRVNAELHRVMDRGAYDVVDRRLLSLRRPEGHRNPHGNRASLSQLKRMMLAVVHYARAREDEARKKKTTELQGENFGRLVGKWGGVDTAAAESRRRLQAHIDDFGRAMDSLAEYGGPTLAAIRNRCSRAREVMVHLVMSPAAQQRAAVANRKHAPTNKPAKRHGARPPVESTRSGRPAAHAPPA